MQSTVTKSVILAMLLFISTAVISGCGSPKATSETPVDDQTPVTLTLFDSGWITPDILDLVKKKFPYITLNVVTKGKGSGLSDLVAQNTVPDILVSYDSGTYTDFYQEWHDLGLMYDLTPLIKKYNLDLSRYNPTFIDNIRQTSNKGEIDALPYYQWIDVIIYNKDIFDKFGVPYPKDGMTWPELLDLSKKLTRQVDGQQYYGFFPRNWTVMSDEYPLTLVDPKTNQADVTNTKWATFAEFYKNLFQAQGMSPSLKVDNAFLQDRTLAMWPIGAEHTHLELESDAAKGLNWDMVNIPTWPDQPGQTEEAGGVVVGISSASQHKDQAFKVISYLGSDELQDALSKDGMPPVLTNPAIIGDFGKNNPNMQGKNIHAIQYKSFAQRPALRSLYENLAISHMKLHIQDIASGNKDINTALNEAAQDINQAIATAKQQETQK